MSLIKWLIKEIGLNWAVVEAAVKDYANARKERRKAKRLAEQAAENTS